MKKSFINPVLFLIVLISFLLPFFSISCQGQTVLQATGTELITGISWNSRDNFNNNQPEEKNNEPLAIFLLIVVLTGLAVSFLKNIAGLLSAFFAFTGFVLTIIIGIKIDNRISSQNAPMLKMNYESGYYIILIILAAISAYNIYLLYKAKQDNTAFHLSP